jgi:hypothetical protein
VWGAAAVRRALVARGWGLERAPDGRWRDVCPACAAVLRDALAPTGPRPIGEAAGPVPEADAAG